MRWMAWIAALVSSLGAADAAAQGVPDRLAALEARIAALEGVTARAEITVACGAGETIGAALTRYAAAETLFIRVSGVCVESVSVFHDNVVILGTAAGDGVRSPNTITPAIQVFDGSVSLVQLTLEAANHAVSIARGGTVRGRHLIIRAGGIGARADGGDLRLEDSVIEQALPAQGHQASGVWSTGANVRLTRTTIRGFTQTVNGGGGSGVQAYAGSVLLDRTIVEGNHDGIVAIAAALEITSSSIRDNAGRGVELSAGSSLTMNGGDITRNGGDGITAISSIVRLLRAVIETNTTAAVRARAASIVTFGEHTIARGNGGALQLSDHSIAVTDHAPGVQLTGNQRGVICLGSGPDSALSGYISAFGGTFHLNASNVFGNGPAGPNISCPGIFIP